MFFNDEITFVLKGRLERLMFTYLCIYCLILYKTLYLVFFNVEIPLVLKGAGNHFPGHPGNHFPGHPGNHFPGHPGNPGLLMHLQLYSQNSTGEKCTSSVRGDA